MSTKNTCRAIAFALLAAVSASANAANPATATFQVLITILKACTVTAGAASNINLGSVAATAVNTTLGSTISVNCSKTTPYFVGLSPSNNNTAGAGMMVSSTAPATNTDKVPYQLTSTAGAGGTPWGNTATSTTVGNGVMNTGTGATQTLNVYATAASANFTPDSYVDTVTVNVNVNY